MLARLKGALTAKRRKAIYGLATALLVTLLAFNIVTAEQISVSTEAIVKIMTALTTLMAFLNTTTD